MPTDTNLTPKLVASFLELLQVRLDRGPGLLNMLCLQGVNPTPDGNLQANDNKDNEYNDSIVLFWYSSDGVRNIRAMLGTVDPGLAYRDLPGGEAHLTFGQHLYVQGLHTGKPALRAKNEVNRVWRDPDKNNVPSAGDYVSKGPFGVNIHPGGKTKNIDNWSAGCINICGGWDGEPWKFFMGLVGVHFAHRSDLGVTVWRGSDYLRFVEKGAMPPTLSFGTLNPWVKEMQQALKVKGYLKTEPDGDWGSGTDSALRAFQKASGLKDDGICGPKTWEALVSVPAAGR